MKSPTDLEKIHALFMGSPKSLFGVRELVIPTPLMRVQFLQVAGQIAKTANYKQGHGCRTPTRTWRVGYGNCSIHRHKDTVIYIYACICVCTHIYTLIHISTYVFHACISISLYVCVCIYWVIIHRGKKLD